MRKTDNVKLDDIIFSLKKYDIIEWRIIAISSTNPENEEVFVVRDSEKNIEHVRWRTLEYGGDIITFFSLTKEDLLNRFKKYTDNIINQLTDEKK
jgi:hypothetical protein